MPGLVLNDDRRNPVLAGVQKGDWVRLLEPHYDGYQLLPEGAIVHWWNDDPPSANYVALSNHGFAPDDVPHMTDGEPPADYLDPRTGKRPVPGSI
ncbi:hypothetical protein [Reyranella sp.]|uniref:hypothetical protein n=1 Tax=Reyranella sp. TaxID=1929291 RepID=UPI003D0EAE4D